MPDYDPMAVQMSGRARNRPFTDVFGSERRTRQSSLRSAVLDEMQQSWLSLGLSWRVSACLCCAFLPSRAQTLPAPPPVNTDPQLRSLKAERTSELVALPSWTRLDGHE